MSIFWLFVPALVLLTLGWCLRRLGRWMQAKGASMSAGKAPSEPSGDEEPAPAPVKRWQPPESALRAAEDMSYRGSTARGAVLPFIRGRRLQP